MTWYLVALAACVFVLVTLVGALSAVCVQLRQDRDAWKARHLAALMATPIRRDPSWWVPTLVPTDDPRERLNQAIWEAGL